VVLLYLRESLSGGPGDGLTGGVPELSDVAVEVVVNVGSISLRHNRKVDSVDARQDKWNA
jgi:hypothetical protein